ncbi:MAG: hypothetical protein LKH33_04655 [Acetobacter sp.]|nr:hypothetical protein [Acetobacter sp.]MCH4062031.1 hypothetical protein [Acetobacter sp.]MCH4089120.1 hypothetical protein [Acetobacter sp.]MCI1485087.1 hypothetical protein [Acetobacter sp.]MCI1601004.1 hypothetical protein [Acetobacter sp.]
MESGFNYDGKSGVPGDGVVIYRSALCFPVVCILLSGTLMPVCAWSSDGLSGKIPTSHESGKDSVASEAAAEKAKMVARLAQAKSHAESLEISAALEALREEHLTPVTTLLLKRAHRHLAAGQAADAVTDLGDAVTVQGDIAFLWRILAEARLSAGQGQEAITDLGAALRLDGDDALTWAALSRAEESVGDGMAAFRAWEQVLKLDPNVEGGRHRLQTLHLKAYGQPA